MLSINPKMLPRLDELAEDLLARRQRANEKGWQGEIERLDLSLTFLRSKREQAQRFGTPDRSPWGCPWFPTKSPSCALDMRQTDVMGLEWALIRGLVATARTVKQLLADESAKRMPEILGAVAEVHRETAQRQWLDARKLQGPEQALKLEAVANTLEVSYTARAKELDMKHQEAAAVPRSRRVGEQVTRRMCTRVSDGLRLSDLALPTVRSLSAVSAR